MSATGTAIQIQRVRPRRAILMSAVLAATLGVGFFVGRATDATLSSAPEGVAVAIPELGWQTDGALTKGRIYEKTLGGTTDGIGLPAFGGIKPHLPKRAEGTGSGPIEGSDANTVGGFQHHLPERWHLNG